MGPKSENVGFSLVLPLLFEGSRGPRAFYRESAPERPERLGGGRGRVYPPPTPSQTVGAGWFFAVLDYSSLP